MKTTFNNEEIYKEYIDPLVRRIMLECVKSKIPVFMSFAVADDGKETTYHNEFLSSENAGVKLTDDHGYRHVNVMNGFFTSPRQERNREVMDEVIVDKEGEDIYVE